MTDVTFTAIRKRMTASINGTRKTFAAQLDIAKTHYKMACEWYGSHSEQAGKWDRIVCALQAAIEALSEI